MATYRKKPVEVQAWPVKDIVHQAAFRWGHLPIAVVAAYEQGLIIFLPDGLLIKTTEGSMRAELDDWLVEGTRGEFYPCKPGPFEDTFEKVPPPTMIVDSFGGAETSYAGT